MTLLLALALGLLGLVTGIYVSVLVHDHRIGDLSAGQYVAMHNGQRGDEFTVLHVDSDTLARTTSRHGWSCEVVGRRGGHYLARLCPAA